MARLRHTVPRTQAPVFDWIPPRYHDKILDGTSTEDLTSYLAAAHNEDASYEKVWEPGLYNVGSEIVLTATPRIVALGATLKALSGFAADTKRGRQALLSYSLASAIRIRGLAFNCNGQNCNGLYIGKAIRPSFEDCGFSGMPAGYAGMRGSVTLYGRTINCGFTGLGRSFDFQKGWEYLTYMTGSPNLTFTDLGATGSVDRDTGSWITDGFVNGNTVRFEGSAFASNNVTVTITAITATKLTFNYALFTNEGPVAGVLAIKDSGTYYGYHASVIRDSVFGCREGLRSAGYCHFDHNDHEHGVWQAANRNENPSVSGAPLCAAIVLGEELASSMDQNHALFTHVYTELSEGTAGKLRGVGTATTGNSAAFQNCQILGSSASVVDSVAIYNLLDTGSDFSNSNLLKKWMYGFEGGYSGGSNHNAMLNLLGAFTTNDVASIYKAGAGVQPNEMVRATGAWNDMHFDHVKGVVIAPNVAHVAQAITPDTSGNKFKLSQARNWKVSRPSLTTLTSAFIDSTYTSPGQEFTLQFADNNSVLDATAWGLSGGVNRAFNAGESHQGYVDWNGVIREKGAIETTLDDQNLAFSAALAAATAEAKTVALAGAAVGDNVVVNPRQALPDGVSFSARVSAAATLSIKVWNGSGGAVNLSAITWDVALRKG